MSPTLPVVILPLDTARKAFDIAVGSMDFGSGFLDNSEVDALRAFATLIGVDPIEATPHGFKTQYRHEFRPMLRPASATPYWEEQTAGKCYHCYRPQEEPVHG